MTRSRLCIARHTSRDLPAHVLSDLRALAPTSWHTAWTAPEQPSLGPPHSPRSWSLWTGLTIVPQTTVRKGSGQGPPAHGDREDGPLSEDGASCGPCGPASPSPLAPVGTLPPCRVTCLPPWGTAPGPAWICRHPGASALRQHSALGGRVIVRSAAPASLVGPAMRRVEAPCLPQRARWLWRTEDSAPCRPCHPSHRPWPWSGHPHSPGVCGLPALREPVRCDVSICQCSR